jgi:hypothetical protein
MRRASPEDEALIPRISPRHFTEDISAREIDISSLLMQNLLSFAPGCSWKIVGWALAEDVAPREVCPYVILFEKEDKRVWLHCMHVTIEAIAERLRTNPSKVAPL